jgi:putative protease
MSGTKVGEVTHYYDQISVAVIDLSGDLRVGDHVQFLGRLTDFRQEVESMQIEHQAILEARAGQEIAIKVERQVRPRDNVFRITGEG